MKKIYSLTLIILFLSACKNETETSDSTGENETKKHTSAITAKNKTNSLNDYNNDGEIDEATVIKTKMGAGNPVEDGTPDEYAIQFSEGRLPELPIGCCEAIIINEGDLDNDGINDFSVFQAPMNGCVYTMTTYTFKKGAWKKLFEPFLIPTGCDEVSITGLEARVFSENRKIFIMETDMNDENMKLIKTEVKLLNP